MKNLWIGPTIILQGDGACVRCRSSQAELIVGAGDGRAIDADAWPSVVRHSERSEAAISGGTSIGDDAGCGPFDAVAGLDDAGLLDRRDLGRLR